MLSGSRNYTEKRDFIRMRVNYPVKYQKTDSSMVCDGQCINLSATGAKLQVEDVLPIGTKLKISLVPSLKISPDLTGFMEVLRVEAVEGSQSYYISGVLETESD